MMTKCLLRLLLAWAAIAAFGASSARSSESVALTIVRGDFVAEAFRFSDGTQLRNVRLHYVTLGKLRRDAAGHASNAVLLLHGTNSTGAQFLGERFRHELFAAGAPLDAQRWYVILPDGIGRGGSAKPSDGLGAKFPRYGYRDVVEGYHRLVTDGLHVDHLRLVAGTSMGGMHTWLWGEAFPGTADALMPIAAQPIALAGRNWFWRQMIISAIENDPDFHGGAYTRQPRQWLRALPVFVIMTDNPARLQAAAGDRGVVKKLYDDTIARFAAYDANDVLNWFRSSEDYDPEPGLNRITAKVLAVNFADDLINATDLHVMQTTMPRVKNGRFVEIPEGDHSHGHATLGYPEVWKQYVTELLAASPALPPRGSRSP